MLSWKKIFFPTQSNRDDSYLILSYRFTKFYTPYETIDIFHFSKISNPSIIKKLNCIIVRVLIIIIIMKIKKKIWSNHSVFILAHRSFGIHPSRYLFLPAVTTWLIEIVRATDRPTDIYNKPLSITVYQFIHGGVLFLDDWQLPAALPDSRGYGVESREGRRINGQKRRGEENGGTSHVKSGRNGIAKGKRTRGFPFSP